MELLKPFQLYFFGDVALGALKVLATRYKIVRFIKENALKHLNADR